MRTPALVPVLLAALALASPAAFAQSEDEQMLKQGQPPSGNTSGDPASPSSTQTSSASDSGSSEGTDKGTRYSDDELDEQVFYSGMGVDRVSTDYTNLKDAINLDLTLGFRIPTAPWFGLEIDLGQTIIPGEYRDPKPAQPAGPSCSPVPTPGCGTPAQPAEDGAYDRQGDEFGMQALGLSLALKTTGRFYLTGKYGYRYIATSNDTINENRSGKGFAAGVGYRWGRGLSGVELGYKQLAENVDSIGLTFFVRSRR